jgi:hypothetical protein
MAYGVNAPFGLRPISSISGGPWTDKTNTYNIYTSANGATTYATSLFTGDPVIWNPANASTIPGYPTIARYDFDVADIDQNITPVLGVFMGCEYIDVNQKLIKSDFWPASTPVYPGSKITALIMDDPDVVCEIQVSTATNAANDARFGGTTNTAATAAYFGQNFAFGIAAGGGNLSPQNPTSGSVITGQSAVYLNMIGTNSTDRVAATLPLKAIGYSQSSKQTNVYASDGTTAKQFLNVRVVINNHVFRVGQLGVTRV